MLCAVHKHMWAELVERGSYERRLSRRVPGVYAKITLWSLGRVEVALLRKYLEIQSTSKAVFACTTMQPTHVYE